MLEIRTLLALSGYTVGHYSSLTVGFKWKKEVEEDEFLSGTYELSFHQTTLVSNRYFTSQSEAWKDAERHYNNRCQK